MKSKIVEETKVVKKEIFVADDGTEFKRRNECAEYEAKLLDKKIAGIKTCTVLNGYMPFAGDECLESHSYKWFYPVSIKEIDLLNERYSGCEISYNCINEWICFEESDSKDFIHYALLKSCIRYAKAVLEKLGYKMTVEKVGEADE